MTGSDLGLTSGAEPVSILVVGLAVTGRAVVDAALRRGHDVSACDDRATDLARLAAADRGITLVESPDAAKLAELVRGADMVVPSPGVPRHHDVYAIADQLSTPIVSEFDLAAAWDDRPIAAITGTNGKTTVTTLVTGMLRRSGIAATAAGNVETPLVEAIDRPDNPPTEVFVVEASSFRLERTATFAPRVGAWLNLAADHLDWHRDLEQYAQAKARIWSAGGSDRVAVIPTDDPAIAKFAEASGRRILTFGLESGYANWAGDELAVGPDSIVSAADLPKRLPHDLLNAAAAAAVAREMGATIDGIQSELVAFGGLAHRMALVRSFGGVDWYDDSKATTPDATIAGVGGLSNVVLIAGGSQKGLDLSALASLLGRLTAVVAIGETAPAVVDVFTNDDGCANSTVPVTVGETMADAVAIASKLAVRGGAVVLSPACASFDWYSNYAERGRHFCRLVDDLVDGENT